MSTAFKQCEALLEELNSLLGVVIDVSAAVAARIDGANQLDRKLAVALDLLAPLRKRAAETVPEKKVRRPAAHLFLFCLAAGLLHAAQPQAEPTNASSLPNEFASLAP